MKYYLIFADERKTTILSYGKLESTLSSNHPTEWFDTEAELEARVDELKGKDFYAKQVEE